MYKTFLKDGLLRLFFVFVRHFDQTFYFYPKIASSETPKIRVLMENIPFRTNLLAFCNCHLVFRKFDLKFCNLRPHKLNFMKIVSI